MLQQLMDRFRSILQLYVNNELQILRIKKISVI
jgi:hypothetical protein